MSDIEAVIRHSKKLEKQLEQHYGASGRGLHEKASSVEDQLDRATLKSLRWVATMRNKVVHEDDFKLDNIAEFEATCLRLAEQLDAKTNTDAPNQNTAAQTDPATTKTRRKTSSNDDTTNQRSPAPRVQPQPRMNAPKKPQQRASDRPTARHASPAPTDRVPTDHVPIATVISVVILMLTMLWVFLR